TNGDQSRVGKYFYVDTHNRHADDVYFNCPYGEVGDYLWVRETWNHSNYPYGPYDSDCLIFYRADYDNDLLDADRKKSSDGIRRKWKPAIHMPRSASRIRLEIMNIRVERLQDISEEDVIAEGILCISKAVGDKKIHQSDLY